MAGVQVCKKFLPELFQRKSPSAHSPPPLFYFLDNHGKKKKKHKTALDKRRSTKKNQHINATSRRKQTHSSRKKQKILRVSYKNKPKIQSPPREIQAQVLQKLLHLLHSRNYEKKKNTKNKLVSNYLLALRKENKNRNNKKKPIQEKEKN